MRISIFTATSGISGRFSLLPALAVCGICLAAQAQEADQSPPLIAQPAAPPHYNGPKPKSLEEVMRMQQEKLRAATSSLSSNLDVLYNVNSDDDQKALDNLGKNYANSPELGTHFRDAMQTADIARLKDNLDRFGSNASGEMNDFAQSLEKMIKTVNDAHDDYVKKTGYSEKNPPPPSEMLRLQGEVNDLTARMKPAVTGLGKQQVILGRLIKNLNVLASNVASLNQTYINLLKLGDEKPSVVLETPGLSTTLQSLDNLAVTQMRQFITFNNEMDKINALYDTIGKYNGTNTTPEKDKAQIQARMHLTDELHILASDTESLNNSLAMTLGRPQQNESEMSKYIAGYSSSAPTETQPDTSSGANP